jgi:putative acetyltransferase
MSEAWRLRPACNYDGGEIAALIDRVYREHGDRLAARRGDRDLLTIEESFWAKNGAFVLLEAAHERSNAGEIIGTAAMMPLPCAGAATLRRFYVAPQHRGRGAGKTLIRWALSWAKLRGYERLEFWSDSRFASGHRFFERIGLRRIPEERDMHDGVISYREVLFGGAVAAIASQVSVPFH